jgi:hypothetical protein
MTPLVLPRPNEDAAEEAVVTVMAEQMVVSSSPLDLVVPARAVEQLGLPRSFEDVVESRTQHSLDTNDAVAAGAPCPLLREVDDDGRPGGAELDHVGPTPPVQEVIARPALELIARWAAH